MLNNCTTYFDMKKNRREFLKKGGTLAALSLAGVYPGNLKQMTGDTGVSKLTGKTNDISPGRDIMKIAFQAPSEPDETDLDFVRQLGVDHVVLNTDGTKASYEYYYSRRKLYETVGIKVYAFGNSSVHNVDAIVLNLPGRDAKIEEYKNHIRNLGKAGIPYTTYAHMGNGIWSTGREPTRGNAQARTFDLEKATTGEWAGKKFEGPLTHGRRYTKEEIWANYEYFIKQAAAVAEENNVKIGIHPDDPPVPELGGVPRCIFSNFDGYKKALEIADSPNVGMCLCVGCWLEGGPLMGRDVIETIKYFGERKKIFKVHLRNVNQPLPHFTETFINDGYANMYKILKALDEVDFDGVIIADHIPAMAHGPYTGTVFSIGYMKGMVEHILGA
jgi:mannonate dehydratase